MTRGGRAGIDDGVVQRDGFEADLRRLYPDLDGDLLARIGNDFEQVALAGGLPLMREGETSDALYILMSGRLAASRAGPDGQQRIGEIGRGEMIGEMSLLGGGLRTATVTALRDSRLVRISNQAFLSFMQQHPSVTRQFIQLLIRRLAGPARQDVQRLSTIALMPAHPDGSLHDFAADLAAAMARAASALFVTRAQIEQSFPGCLGTPNESQVTAWLDEHEGCHLLNRSPFAVALGAMAAADFALIVFDPLGNVLKLTDQLPQGDRALQRRGGYGAAPEMPFGPARHLEAGVHQPALAVVVEIKTEAVVLDWLGGEGGGLEHFGLQTHQHGGSQKGFAGLGQVLFVAATGGGHQPGHLNPLA
jgi:CRP-like cAMP-binding protein